MTRLWLARALGLGFCLVALFYTAALEAQVAAPACFPACRDGYTCHQGRCVSLCNPPCPAGLVCVEGRRCEPPLTVPGAGAYEPPPPPRKPFEALSFGMLGFHLGFPGKVERDGLKRDLDSSKPC